MRCRWQSEPSTSGGLMRYTESLHISPRTTIGESFQGGKSSAEMHCVVAGTVIDTKEAGTFQGDTSFHSETRATYTPAFYGKTESTTIVDQKYVGSCPAAAQPGDRTDANGRVTHLGKH